GCVPARHGSIAAPGLRRSRRTIVPRLLPDQDRCRGRAARATIQCVLLPVVMMMPDFQSAPATDRAVCLPTGDGEHNGARAALTKFAVPQIFAVPPRPDRAIYPLRM